MEYLKTLWVEARPKQRMFIVAVAVIVVLGVLASAAKASSPLDGIRDLPGVSCEYFKSDGGVMIEQCVSEEPITCLSAADYPNGPHQLGESIGGVLFYDEQLSNTEWLYFYAATDGTLGGFVYDRSDGTIFLHILAVEVGEAL